jgi:hypothetical protein
MLASRFVAPERQTHCFKRLLDDMQLTLVRLKIKDLTELVFSSDQVLGNSLFEFLLAQFEPSVQNSCTIKPLTIPPRHLLKEMPWTLRAAAAGSDLSDRPTLFTATARKRRVRLSGFP